MVRKRKLNFLAIMFLVFAVVFTSVILSVGNLNSSNTSAYKTLPNTPDAEDNLFFEDISKFNLNAFDELSSKLGYSKIEDLVSGYTSVKTAADLGSEVVALGSYKARNGVQQQLNWIPTYLSKDKSGNVILTLWLAQTASNNSEDTSYQERSWFSDGTYHLTNTKTYKETSTSATQNVYSNSYDGSYVRHAMLLADDNYIKAWGWYWNNAQVQISTTRVTMPAKSSLNKFTQFTTGAISSYLVAPSNVAWQMSESAHPNDPSYSNVTNYPNNWTNDKIWLVSASEIDDNALWKVNNSQRLNTYNTYLRSAGTNDKARAGVIDGTGASYYNFDVGDVTMAIRPAFHLNLSAVINNGIRAVAVPKEVKTIYNANAQTLVTLDSDGDAPDWYNPTKVSFTYSTTTMKDVGTYSVTAKLNKTDTKDAWRDGTTENRTFNFIIEQKSITFPTWVTGKDKAKYAGADPLYFLILSTSYDKDYVKIDIPTDLKSKVTFNPANPNEIEASNLDVGTYALDVSLKDTKNTKWAGSTGHTLAFTINAKTLVADSLSSSSGASELTSSRNSTLSLVLTLKHDSPIVDMGKNVKVSIIANSPGIGVSEEVGSVILDSTGRVFDVNLTFSGTPNDATYTLDVEIDTTDTDYPDGKNYELTQNFTTTVKLMEGVRNMLTWQLLVDGREKFGQYIDVSTNTQSATFNKDPIVYDGKTYSFQALLPTGYTLDTSFGTDGYQISPIGANSNVGVNAGGYKTQIRMKDPDGQLISTPYEVNWEIEKAKFDLSSVKWINDGKVEYNEGADVSPVLDPDTIPDGLIVNYSGSNVGNKVGDGGNAIVTFALATGYLDNYELPANGGKGTNYEFKGDGDFEWEKDWDVIPAIIKLEWEEKAETDANGNPFNVLVLKDPRVDGKVDYLFYETDNRGNIKDIDNPLTLDQIEVSLTDRKYYKVLPSIKSGYANNYEFPNNNTADYSIVFSIGGGASGVTVALDKDSIEYTGKPVNLKVNITGAATLNQLTLTYYSGDIVDDTNKLESAPTNAGKYTVVITSNTPSVLLGGTTQFEFEITKSVISTAWNNNAKPPVLNLKYGQLNGIEYEIVDSNNVPITSISQIVAGDYAIRAKITDTANYIFDDNTVETDWVQFTVRQGDAIYDPSDPSNPFNPTDPDNPIGPGNGDGDDGSVLDKIKEFFENLIASNFPLWQVCTMAVGGLLSLIFLIKSIQYGKRRKNAKNETKKINAKTYATIAPIFATDIIYAGLTNQIWSIIAFSVVGLTAFLFIVMLLTRHGWKKAELAKENALEEREQRKYEAQEARQLAREEAQDQRQRELQATISQVGLGGSDNSVALIEEMRREMEARHREEMEALSEEQAKRDEAMKLMLANLMGRAQGEGDMPFYGSVDDADLLADKVFARLLPAVQQMMPENTAYLTAPAYENDERYDSLLNKIDDLQQQLADMSQERVEGVLLPDQSEEIKALTAQIAELQEQLANSKSETVITADNSEEIKALTAEVQKQFAKIDDLQNQLANMSQGGTTTVFVEKDSEDDDVDDEEEWDSILDEDDDDFLEAVIIEEDGTVKKTSPNFRMRLKQSSDKNREWYTAIKNLFCSQKGVTYRVYKRVEKIRYQGQVIAVIGIAKRSIKLWLALKPYEYDARRYHHKDVSDKPRFVDVPMYVRVGSDRALTRAQELILALFQEQNMEARKRYNDRTIQELIFTLKHNKLLTNKQNKQLLCEVMHVHDCDVLSDELAEKCIETKNVEFIDDSVIETVKLDDIDAHFQDGNRVTLDKLKKVGLVSEECTGYNVVADKRLTKPLIIVANDFNLTAVKLIALTGGRAIKLTQV